MQSKNFLFKDIEKDNLVKYMGRFIHDNITKTNPKVDKYIIVIDTEGFTSDNFDMDKLKALAPILGNYFPDMLYKMFLINVGFMIKMLYKGISLFLHPVTREKIQVIGGGNAILEKFLTVMSMDEIP